MELDTQTVAPPSEGSAQLAPTGAAPASTPEAGALATGAGEQATEPKTYTSWKDALADADPEELVKDPRVAGRLGDLAEKRARALTEKITKEVQEKAEAANLRTLRDTDPYEFARVEREREERATAFTAEMAKAQGLGKAVSDEIAAYAAKTFSADVLQQVAQKADGKPLPEGVRTWVEGVIEASKDAWKTELRTQWEKEETPALRKRLLAEMNGTADRGVDIGTGSAPAGALTQEEWDRHRNDRAWRMANRERTNAALSQGRITH